MRLAQPARSRPERAWCLSVYPAAGEAGGSYQSFKRRRPRGSGRYDPERAAAEAARRARAKVRRYCAGNGLNRLATLTYAGEGCHDPLALREDIGDFFRSIRADLGKTFPYLWTGEIHPGGHGFHVHFAVGRFIKQRLIRDVWGHGHVHIKLIGDLPVGSGVVQEARQASRYLAKYVSKGEGGGRPAGLHRYEVAQGFQPDRVLVYGWSADDVIMRASAFMHQSPSRVWRSDDETGWEGPPAVWVAWDRGR
jgi:hypothetical protein